MNPTTAIRIIADFGKSRMLSAKYENKPNVHTMTGRIWYAGVARFRRLGIDLIDDFVVRARDCVTKIPALLSRSGSNLPHGRLRQIVSSELVFQSMPVDPHRPQRRSFSSLLLGRKMMYFVIAARKYAKVGMINMNGGITW